jgi:hypothetical protein
MLYRQRTRLDCRKAEVSHRARQSTSRLSEADPCPAAFETRICTIDPKSWTGTNSDDGAKAWCCVSFRRRLRAREAWEMRGVESAWAGAVIPSQAVAGTTYWQTSVYGICYKLAVFKDGIEARPRRFPKRRRRGSCHANWRHLISLVCQSISCDEAAPQAGVLATPPLWRWILARDGRAIVGRLQLAVL